MEKLERKLERARSGESSGRASNALATFELTRPVVGASALGIAQAAYEWTLVLPRQRRARRTRSASTSTRARPPAGRRSSARAIQQRLADVATEIEAARLLVQRASWMGRNGIPMTGGQGSMSKLKGGDVAMWATRTCMDLVGPYAQTTDCPLEKWFRDAKIYQLFEGTAEIQRLVISRMQAAEYRERFKQGAEVAAQAIESAASAGNGSRASGDGTAAAPAEAGNGAGRPARSRPPAPPDLPAPPSSKFRRSGAEIPAAWMSLSSGRWRMPMPRARESSAVPGQVGRMR